MVTHVVLLRWKPTTSPEEAGATLAAVRGLADAVPGIVELRCGENFSRERAAGFEAALVVVLRDRAALAGYADHPRHLPVKARIAALCAQVLALDFEG